MPYDLSVNGPYSPISLKKFLHASAKKSNGNQLRVLIDNTGAGISKDDPLTLVMDAEDRIQQARFFRETVFDGKKLPGYLFRYLRFMFINTDNQYPDDATVMKAFRSGELNFESPDYQAVVNLVRHSGDNREAAQLIGFIQLFAGTVHQAAKESKSIRLFIDHPETDLHPERAARFMSLYYKLLKEYGGREEK